MANFQKDIFKKNLENNIQKYKKTKNYKNLKFNFDLVATFF